MQLFFNGRKLALSCLLNLGLLITSIATCGMQSVHSICRSPYCSVVPGVISDISRNIQFVCCMEIGAVDMNVSGNLGLHAGAFYKIRPEAGQLLLPYVAWLCFANILNLVSCKFDLLEHLSAPPRGRCS